MPKNKQPLTGQQELFIRMSARAASRKDILREVFKIDTETDGELAHAADCKMSRWRKLPEYEAVWKDEVKKILYESAGTALKVLNRQMTNEDNANQPWLQNKAANDLLQYGKGQIYGNEENAVTVRIEGMPEIGIPDGE